MTENGGWLARLRATDRGAEAANRTLGFDRPPGDGHLRVAIDVRIPCGVSGGVEQAITGLAEALAELKDGDEEYLFLLHRGESEWILPYLKGPCRPLWARERWFFGPNARFARESDGVIERAGAGVMHFTWQWAFLTAVPSLYQPWDLQHRRLPAFFSEAERARREATYPRFCERAERVVVPSHATAGDLQREYGVASERIARVPVPTVLRALVEPRPADLQRVRSRYSLPEAFAFFPSQAWPHKNHAGLLQALARLRREHGLSVPLVCTGASRKSAAPLERLAAELGMAGQVQFLGFIPAGDLRCLYRIGRVLTFPSLFEGWGFPVLEAMEEGMPVVCSNRASLPEIAGDAALLFDPEDESAMSDAILRVWSDDGLRIELRERGRARAACFSWERTARVYRAVYRRAAGRPLTNEDESLLAATAV